LDGKNFVVKFAKTKIRSLRLIPPVLFVQNQLLFTKVFLNQVKINTFFCNHICAASFNNKLRLHSEQTKEKIKQSLIFYHETHVRPDNGKDSYRKRKKNGTCRKFSRREKRKCIVCSKEFTPRQDRYLCCSRDCGYLYQFGVEPCGKDELINAIVSIFNKTGRTPMRREVKTNVRHAANRLFGSWNKTIVSCGLKPNGNSPRNIKIHCSDGHVVRSISEKVIDEWFTQNGIKHSIEKLYPLGKYTCDFHLSDYDIWVEYFGLAGAFEEYDNTMRIKIEMAKEHNLNLISIYPKDLYPDCKLDDLIKINKS
jgi:hypothetical protein